MPDRPAEADRPARCGFSASIRWPIRSSVKRRIGVVPEDLALFDRLTASETLRFVADVHGIDTATVKARSADLLKLMALESAGNTLVTDYSHGMRKKLSLAAALLPAPRLLFLDEPFEGIDAVASRQIKDLLLSFVARGGTIFLTSHILEIVERLSTHIGVIAQGKLVAQAPVAELRGAGRARRSKSCSSGWWAAKRRRAPSWTGSR